MMNKILIIFAHPAKKRSKINKELLAAIKNIEGVTLNDLYANYPDFLFDVKREQQLCEEHDVIIFQHPLYWYSIPSIMKEWQDLVLEHGWAYGSTGLALKDKLFMQAFTAGGDADTYTKEGINGFTITELTTPLRGMAKLCNMKWVPPFAIHGIHHGMSQEQVTHHSENYRKLVLALRDGRLKINELGDIEFMCENLDSLIRRV